MPWAFLDASCSARLRPVPATTPASPRGWCADLGPSGDTPESGAKASRLVTALMSTDPLGPSGDLLVTAPERCASCTPPGGHLLAPTLGLQPVRADDLDAVHGRGVPDLHHRGHRRACPHRCPHVGCAGAGLIDVWRVIGTVLGLPIEAVPPTVAPTRHLGDVLNTRLEDVDAMAVKYVAGNIAAQAKFVDPPVPSAIGRRCSPRLTRKDARGRRGRRLRHPPGTRSGTPWPPRACRRWSAASPRGCRGLWRRSTCRRSR